MQFEVRNLVCCRKCVEGETIAGMPIASLMMIVCQQCGNKRCPKATDHTLTCTNSNEPGQPGSYYGVPNG